MEWREKEVYREISSSHNHVTGRLNGWASVFLETIVVSCESVSSKMSQITLTRYIHLD